MGSNSDASARPGALSIEQMRAQLVEQPGYRVSPESPASRAAHIVRRLWGGRLAPLMAAAETRGRMAGAALSCPPTACTGALELLAGARSEAWRNTHAIESIVCLAGQVVVRFGPTLADSLTLGRYDMASLPAGVRVQLVNESTETARLATVLSISPGQTYTAVFDESLRELVPEQDSKALGIEFDRDAGAVLDPAALNARRTRFDKLVPYKKDLNRTGGLPPEATEALSAGSVFPLIVPEGHVGRSRTAPMYGNQGLYMSIAECRAGGDGPPAHVHSDTQESFFCLDGSFDICTGFDNENVVPLQPGDLMAVPRGVMRTFVNTSGKPARLLVIIQGPDRMNDTVSYSRRLGAEMVRRFGPEVMQEYEKIKMTFDAEDRLQA